MLSRRLLFHLRAQLVIGLVLFLLWGCAVNTQKPQHPELPTNVAFTAPLSAGKTSLEPWWNTNLSASLSERVESMLLGNPAVRIAAKEVEEQRSLLDFAEAQRWLDIQGSASGETTSTDGDSRSSTQLRIDLQLPLDLFSRLQHSRDAAAFDLAASLARLEQERIEQAESFLLQHIEAAEAQQLLQLLDQQIETVSTLLRLTEFRFGQGLVSSVDVLQQREQLASLKQQPTSVRLTLRQALSALAELNGDLPSTAAEGPRKMPNVDANFAISKPADLLQRRPDLIEKRTALMASDKRYAAALSEKLPDISLSSSALLRMIAGDSSRILSAAIDAAVTLFDSGALDANSARKRAELERAGIEYLQSWLTAVRETDDLLQALNTNQEQLQLSNDRTQVASNLFKATKRRYERGVSDYLPVLAALRSLQQQQRDHLALQAQRLRLIVRLHSAMGLPAEDNIVEQAGGRA